MEGIRQWITEHWLAAIGGALPPTTGLTWWLRRSRSIHPLRWLASGSVASIDLGTERIERAIERALDTERIQALERRIATQERQILHQASRIIALEAQNATLLTQHLVGSSDSCSNGQAATQKLPNGD